MSFHPSADWNWEEWDINQLKCQVGQSFSVAELREKCEAKLLSSEGGKWQLVQRLFASIDRNIIKSWIYMDPATVGLTVDELENIKTELNKFTTPQLKEKIKDTGISFGGMSKSGLIDKILMRIKIKVIKSWFQFEVGDSKSDDLDEDESNDEKDEEKDEEKNEEKEYPKSLQPKHLKVHLHDHQLTSIYYMEQLEKTREIIKGKHIFSNVNSGILGDKPGYGKTLSMIGLILRDKMDFDTKTPHTQVTNQFAFSDGSSYKKIETFINKFNCTLIVASPTLCFQWETELERTSKLNYAVVSGSKNFGIDPKIYDVILCSSTMYNRYIDQFYNYVWKRFVFDEAATINPVLIPNMKTVRAQFSWFVTATYYNLPHIKWHGKSSHMMADMFSGMDSRMLKTRVIVNPVDYVEKSHTIPSPTSKEYLCITHNLSTVVHNHVSEEVQNLLNANDMKGALRQMGGKETDNLVDLVRISLEKKLAGAKEKVNLYTKKLKKKNQITKNIEDLEVEKLVKKWTQSREEFQFQIEQLEKNMKEKLDGECPVCMCKIEDPTLWTCCQNILCAGCTAKSLAIQKNCTMCRAKIEPTTQIKTLSKSANKKSKVKNEKKVQKDEEKDMGPMTKLETIINIIKKRMEENEEAKFIIFSGYNETFSQIREILAENSIEHVEILGTKTTREKKIEKFKESSKVLFLNSKSNGAGLNLEMATDIIIYHKMTEPIERQVVGRVARMGKTGDFYIHRLVYNNE